MSYYEQILGTLITSVLDYDNLIKITKDPKVIDLENSQWIPADGRSIEGSDLHETTGMKNAPDLRGKFTRGLNTMYNIGQPLPFDPKREGDPDGQNRIPGHYQPDALVLHNHPAKGIIHGSVCGSNNTLDVDNGSAKYNSDPRFGDHNVDVSVQNNENGAAETRPRNISVYYYIKINHQY